MSTEPLKAAGGFSFSIRVNPRESVSAQARGSNDSGFIAKAKAYGREAGIAIEADAVTAFAKTAEGNTLYREYRRKLLRLA